MEILLNQITGCLQTLAALPSLKPSVEVNRHFRQLVSLVKAAGDQAAQKETFNNLAARIRPLCARGERELEKYWAGHFLVASDVDDTSSTQAIGQLNWADLEQFDYFGNYQTLVRWEMSEIIRYLGRTPQRILMIGSGPLPLTALLMAKEYGAQLDCLDNDAEAVEQSRALVEKLAMGDIRVEQGDLLEQKDFASYDLVLIAALVGENLAEKARLLEHLQKYLQPRQALLMRYATGWKELMYENITGLDYSGFADLQKFDPEGEVINSFLLAKKIWL